MAEASDQPHAPCGFLRHGVKRGDPRNAPRCGARTRQGGCCLAPAIRGRQRCRMHGGRSTGPRTPAGLEASRRARWVHGRCSAEAREEARQVRDLLQSMKALAAAIDDDE